MWFKHASFSGKCWGRGWSDRESCWLVELQGTVQVFWWPLVWSGGALRKLGAVGTAVEVLVAIAR